MPYRWLDIAGNEDALKLLTERQLSADQLPVVLFADGTWVVDPDLETLAARVGLSTQATQEFYDMIVVGAGPAGLAAAVYGASEGLRTLVIEPEAPGGQAGSTRGSKIIWAFLPGLPGRTWAARAHARRRALARSF